MGFWDIVLNGWHSIGRTRCALRIPLFCLSLSRFLSLFLIWWFQQILTSEDWQLTFSFLLQSFPKPFSFRGAAGTTVRGKGSRRENGKMEVSGRVTWHTGFSHTRMRSLISWQKKKNAQVLTDSTQMRQHCYCINNDSRYHICVVVFTAFCCLFPQLFISTVSRSDSTRGPSLSPVFEDRDEETCLSCALLASFFSHRHISEF